MCFVDTRFRQAPARPDYGAIATAVFSQPEVGTVGMSEENALAQYGEIDVFVSQFRPMRHALSERKEHMFMKLIADRATDQVLGVYIVGADAAELIQLAAVAVKAGLKKVDFDATMAVHPTSAEELVTAYKPSYSRSGPTAAAVG